MKRSGKEIVLDILKYAFLLFLVLIFLVPLSTVFFSAFKTNAEYGASNVIDLPNSFLNFANFQVAFTDGNMLRGFLNTMFILFFSLIGSVLTGTMVAYVLNRFSFPFNNIVKGLFFGSIMIPSVVAQISTFRIISALHLFNTRWAAIILYCGTDLISIYIFIQFMENISMSLDESAIVDGASLFTIFYKIVLPLLKPAIATVLITKGVNIYNDFYTQFLYMPDQKLLTISTTLFKFKGPYGSRWEVICAGLIIVIFPTLIAFLALQKQIYSGLVSGSVKE